MHIEMERRALSVICKMLVRRFALFSEKVKCSLPQQRNLVVQPTLSLVTLDSKYSKCAALELVSRRRPSAPCASSILMGSECSWGCRDYLCMFAEYAIIRKRLAALLSSIWVSSNPILDTVKVRYSRIIAVMRQYNRLIINDDELSSFTLMCYLLINYYYYYYKYHFVHQSSLVLLAIVSSTKEP